MTLLQNATAMRNGISVPFQGDAGTPPYTYAVLPSGVGGTINPTTGVYTSPNSGEGNDTIEVTDSLLATAQATITVMSPLKLVCDIIKKEMVLAQDQIYLWDQKFNSPNDSRLYVVIGELVPKPFSNVNRQDGSGIDLKDVQTVNFASMLSIDIQSRSTEALTRKAEVLLALNSTYARQQMALNGFFIAPQTTAFVNLSQQDGAAIPYRYNLSVTMQYQVTKIKAIPFYDEFFEGGPSEPEVTTDP